MRQLLSALCLISLLAMPRFAFAADKVVAFEPYPQGLAFRLVYDAWMHDPDYKSFTSFMDSPPHFMVAQADLNGDGVDEIFARHAERDSEFCNNFGEECRVQVYKVDNGQLVEIGRMYSSQNINVGEDKTLGYANLRIARAKNKLVEYHWDGKHYAE